jgi:hypothetical protein
MEKGELGAELAAAVLKMREINCGDGRPPKFQMMWE